MSEGSAWLPGGILPGGKRMPCLPSQLAARGLPACLPDLAPAFPGLPAWRDREVRRERDVTVTSAF